MPRIPKYSRKGFTQSDTSYDLIKTVNSLLGTAHNPVLNNLFIKARNPIGNKITDNRLVRLREITQANVAPFLELIEEGVVSPQECVVIFLVAALFVQQGYIMGKIKN